MERMEDMTAVRWKTEGGCEPRPAGPTLRMGNGSLIKDPRMIYLTNKIIRKLKRLI